MFSLRSSLILSLAFTSGVFAQSAAELVAKLRAAPSSNDRLKMLDDKDFVFDFLNQATGETNGAAGHTVAATAANMPALVGNGMAMTIGFLGPCGMNTPHTHPRATEFNFAVNGSLQAGLLVENGARFIVNDLPPGSAAIFPKGAIHFEVNNACEPAVFVAAFNDEDPGVDQIAQRFFGLPPAILQATLGGVGVEVIAELESKIPDNVAFGSEECLRRCGINSFTGQPTKQRQPRVSGNAFPSGISYTPANTAQASATATSTTVGHTGSPSASGFISQETMTDAIGAAAGFTDANGSPNTLVIALLVVVCVLAAGYIVLGAVYFIRSRRERANRTRGGVYFKTGSQFAPQGAVFEGEKTQPFESYNHEHERTTPYDAPEGRA